MQFRKKGLKSNFLEQNTNFFVNVFRFDCKQFLGVFQTCWDTLYKLNITYVVIFLQGTFGSSDDSGCTLAQVVAKEGLVEVRAREILVVATFRIFRATALTFFRISDKSMDFNGVFPKTIKHIHSV